MPRTQSSSFSQAGARVIKDVVAGDEYEYEYRRSTESVWVVSLGFVMRALTCTKTLKVN
jgi:hypothetical protein